MRLGTDGSQSSLKNVVVRGTKPAPPPISTSPLAKSPSVRYHGSPLMVHKVMATSGSLGALEAGSTERLNLATS